MPCVNRRPLGMWEARYAQVAALERAVARCSKGAARNAEHQLQAANLARTRIATEVEALKHLRRKQWQSHKEEAARRTQEQLDGSGDETLA